MSVPSFSVFIFCVLVNTIIWVLWTLRGIPVFYNPGLLFAYLDIRKWFILTLLMAAVYLWHLGQLQVSIYILWMCFFLPLKSLQFLLEGVQSVAGGRRTSFCLTGRKSLICVGRCLFWEISYSKKLVVHMHVRVGERNHGTIFSVILKVHIMYIFRFSFLIFLFRPRLQWSSHAQLIIQITL